MEVRIMNNEAEAASFVADLFERQLSSQPASVLGLATGSTPVGLYRELIRRQRDGRFSFSQATSFNLDEYVGLPADHSQSYRYFMQKHLFDHVDILRENTHVPAGDAQNPLEAGPAYEAAIEAAGGIDLQLLGLGADGHIGFNEQTSSLASRTRIKTLTQRTLSDNARFFGPDEQQPELAITMGIGSILDSRSVVLLACGSKKARAVRDMIEGPVSSMCPGSALQLHPHVTVVVDDAAGVDLELGAYYRWVAEQQDALMAKYAEDDS